MGNQNEIVQYDHEEELENRRTKFSKFLKKKLNKTRQSGSNYCSNDDFIINHTHNNKENDHKVDTESLDQKRAVFISLIGLYKTWKQVPSITLLWSLFIMPLKQKWIYHPSKYADELQSSFISKINTFSDVAETKQFIELLKWKNSQGLIFWMLDDCDYNYSYYQHSPIPVETKQIHQFWHRLSKKLTNLYDPITRNKYNALKIDEKFWENTETFTSKYNTTTSDILRELHFLTMQYHTIQEILYQSNPNSLNPIISYGEHNNIPTMKKVTNKTILTMYGDDDNIDNKDNEREGIWCISPDYDPYDIET